MLQPFVRKKIRGGQRIARTIANWVDTAPIPLDMKHLRHYHYAYERIVHPWKVYVGSMISPPGGFRNEMIFGLLKRYEQWDAQLRNSGEPYYLRIWLYEKTFFESQVVAGIEERIHWYENIFSPVEKKVIFPFQHFEMNTVRGPAFAWTPVFGNGDPDDEDYPKRNLLWVGGLKT